MSTTQNITDIIHTARESMTAKRVFAEPVERDGTTIFPAARITGGVGGGAGTDNKGQNGEGGGFGLTAQPVGAYVLRNGEVSWRPAVDLNRVVTVAGVVLVALILSRGRQLRWMRKHARAKARG